MRYRPGKTGAEIIEKNGKFIVRVMTGSNRAWASKMCDSLQEAEEWARMKIPERVVAWKAPKGK